MLQDAQAIEALVSCRNIHQPWTSTAQLCCLSSSISISHYVTPSVSSAKNTHPCSPATSALPSSSTTTSVLREKPPSASTHRPGSISSLSLPSREVYSALPFPSSLSLCASPHIHALQPLLSTMTQISVAFSSSTSSEMASLHGLMEPSSWVPMYLR